MRTPHVIIIGAGIAGLTAAIDLARRGAAVSIIDPNVEAGGKIRCVESGGASFDAGPTVLTMRWVFDELFSDSGASFDALVKTQALEVLARHAWDDGGRLDLYGDIARSADAVGRFAGMQEAKGFLAFSQRAQDTYRTLEHSFIRRDQPTPISLALGAGFKGLSDLWRISPFTTLWTALGEFFQDQRLRQLFGRYATYVGSSPFDSPATLMLIADVERQGVLRIDGGMHALAAACAALAKRQGAALHLGRRVLRVNTELGRFRSVTLDEGSVMEGDAVIITADPVAVATGLFGTSVEMAAANAQRAPRSLSAMTFCFTAKSEGFDLAHHNVFFCRNYRQEFDDIFRYARVPNDPTIYVCAQDRKEPGAPPAIEGSERFFCLINAPAIGDTHEFTTSEIRKCEQRLHTRLSRCGLKLQDLSPPQVTTPSDFNRIFPATGGALYGQACHGWAASFTRPTARTRCQNVYLAGGGTHPGAGVPMAALSGRIAANAVLNDLTSA